MRLLSAAVDEEKKSDPGLVFEVDASRADEGYETSPTPVWLICLKNFRTKAGTVAFGTEAAQMTHSARKQW